LRAVFALKTFIDSLGRFSPWMLLVLFIGSSFLLILRLEHMTETGVEGTVLGTLVMPYCSGIGNLIFVFVVYTKGQPAAEVMTNCLVNNVTNMTLLIALPVILWGLCVVPKPDAKTKKQRKNNKQDRPVASTGFPCCSPSQR